MPHLFRTLTIILTLMVSMGAFMQTPAFAQRPIAPPPSEGSGAGLYKLEELNATKAGADSITSTMSLVEFEPKYCIPPDEPNKLKEEEWLKGRERTLAKNVARFKALKPGFIDLIRKDGLALKAVLGKLPDGANPLDDRFWQPWETSFKKAQQAIDAKRAELAGIRVEDCSPTPPPPPQPIDWTAGLEPPTFGPPDFPPLPDHHCSWDDYWALIKAIHPYYNKSAEDAQVATRYRDKVGARLVRAKDAGAPAEAIAELQEMFEAASEVAAERQQLSARAAAHYEKAKRIPVVDCRTEQPQTAPDGDQFPQPDYEMFLPPGVPDRFCSEEEKQATLRLLEEAKKVARRNYEKAKAHVADLDNRLKRGDRTPGLADALHEARQAETRFYNQWIELDRAYYKAFAMPVEKCGGVATGARAGAQMGASADAVREVGVRFGAGYKEAELPQQWIGRISAGGVDSALILTPEVLEGFYAETGIHIPSSREPVWGSSSAFRLDLDIGNVEGDVARIITVPDVSGFIWINPLDPGIPFAVGLGTTGLTWDARASSDALSAAATALYLEYRRFGDDLVGSFGAGVMVGVQETEHRTAMMNLDFPGFNVFENYDFSTFAIGPKVEASLKWSPSRTDVFGGRFSTKFSAFLAGTYDSHELEVSQRAMGPVAGGFDYSQHVRFEDDGFNLRYGVGAEASVEFADGAEVFVKAFLTGETDAPTIHPADGSSAPGVPIRHGTDDALEWVVGGGVRVPF